MQSVMQVWVENQSPSPKQMVKNNFLQQIFLWSNDLNTTSELI